MAIFVEDKLKPGRIGENLADAEDIETTGSSNVQTDINNLESAILGWNFNTAITDGSNPGVGYVALNNTDKDAATIISFNTQSAIGNARFDEMLASLEIGDRIYMQERDTPTTNISFRVTQAPETTGTKVNVTVVHERNQGPSSSTFTNDAFIVVKFFFTRTVSPTGLPQAERDWLLETETTDIATTTVTNIAPSVTDVLIWVRAAIVTDGTASNPNDGVLIAEANRQSDGTFDRASGTHVLDTDQSNAYVYIGITASNFDALTLSENFLEARRGTELVFSSSLADLNTVTGDGLSESQFRYRRTTNSQYNYIAGDVLTVVTRDTTTTTHYRYDDTLGDFTDNINDLPYSRLDSQLQAQISGTSDNQAVSGIDRVKLTGLQATTTTQTGLPLTVLYKEGTPSVVAGEYSETWDSNGILGDFGRQRIVSILVNNNVTVTSISGSATLGPPLMWLPGFIIHQVTLPAATGTTPVLHTVTGDLQQTTPTGFDENYKIVRANVESNLLALIDAHGSSADISSLETKVDALFPLTPDVDTLINWANIYDPIHGAATVDIVNGYSLIADHRSASQKYESAGVTFGTDTNVITYTGLSENLHRSFGFALPQTNEVTLTGTSGTANITVNGVAYLATFTGGSLTATATAFVTSHATALSTAGITVTSSAAVLTFVSADPSVTFTITDAVNATGDLAGTSAAAALADKTLMWIVDGGTNIPFVDVTTAGNIRVNNYTPAVTTLDEVSNQVHFLTKQSGPATISQGSGNQRFALPNFPSGATNTSRFLEISPEIFVSGVDTGASGFDPVVTIPATNTAQALQTVSHSFQLGPLHGNRTVEVTTGYEFIVDGADLDVRLTVESAPADVSVNYEGNTYVYLNYTAQSTTARVDNFLTLTDAGGNYVFSDHAEFILSMRPVIGGDGEQTGYLEVVPAAVDSTGVIDQLNDTDVRIPTPLWSGIQVADDIGFKTFVADHYFVHSEVAGLLRHRTERWAYGIARLQTINAGHSITEAVDLASGSTIGGSPIGPGTVQAEVVVYEALNKTTGVDGLVSSVVLPANYATYKYVHVTEYDITNLQFRHAEIPTYIFSAGLVAANDNVRLQGNTVMDWDSGTRTLAMNPVAQEILRVTLKD